jgi:hypothetical protein
MSTLFDWLVYGLPWWVQAGICLLPILALVAVLTRFVGLRAALQIGGALLAALTIIAGRQQARQQGWNERGERDAQAGRDRADERENIAADVRNSSDADLDRRLNRWVRDDKR